jgi:predicted transglutaminase-like cysteine proteinase
VHRTIKAVLAAAAITATATAVQQDANAAFPAFPLQPVPFTDLQQFGPDVAVALPDPRQLSFDRYLLPAALHADLLHGYSLPLLHGYSLPPTADGYALPLHKPYLELSPDPAVSGGAEASSSVTEPLQRVSLGRPEQPPAAPPGPDSVPGHRTSPASSNDADRTSASQLMSPIVRIQFNTPTLAPMAHTFFCLKYPNDCKPHKIVFRGGAVRLTADRWAELVRVNAAVNRAITSQPNTQGLAAEKWLISPRSGECHDYAVTKRHQLLALGWPERDLLLAEVVTSWGEHHLVLVVRTSDGDLVADNLSPNIRSWSRAPYQWVRVQSPDNPTFWSKVASTTVWAKRTGLVNPES